MEAARSCYILMVRFKEVLQIKSSMRFETVAKCRKCEISKTEAGVVDWHGG